MIYRGTAIGVGFFGRYFFADFGARRIWSVRLAIDATTGQATATHLIEHTSALGGSATIGNVSAFGLGAKCEVYFLDWSGGQLRRIVNAGGPLAQCPTSPDPYLSVGGGVFVDGMWVSRDNPLAAGAGPGGMTNSTTCTTPSPASNWVCVNGGWPPPGHPLAGGSAGTGGSGTAGGSNGSTSGGTGSSTCATPSPASNWVCVNGGWLPPGHPLASGSAGTGGTGSTGGSGGSTSGGTGSTTCTTPAPPPAGSA